MTGFARTVGTVPGVAACLITREASYPVDVHLEFPFMERLVNLHSPNVFRRFELAAQAKSDVIYVQDDDACIDIHYLWTYYNGRLTHAITHGHRLIYHGTGVTLIGWGCFFPRWMAQEFVESQAYWRSHFGDDVFEAECDRMFTYRYQPHTTIIMPITQYERPVRMSNRPGHYKTRDQVIKKLKELSS